MAKTKITPDAEETTSTAVAVTESTSVVESSYNPDQYDDTSRDIEIPVLGLVNNVGPLAKKFPNKGGNYVLGEQVLLGEKVEVIPVQIAKFFRETHRNGKEIKYGSPEDKTRRRFASAHDAAKAGYVVDFDNVQPNRVEEGGVVGYLVIAPAGDKSGEFIIRAGDLHLAQAKCSYQRGGFKSVFRRIFEAAHKLALVEGIQTKGLNHSQVFAAAKGWRYRWTLTGELVDGGQNSWWEPRIAKGELLPDDVVNYITTNYGSA
jgi:hypothetical protein